MLENDYGYIVNIASGAAFAGHPFLAEYCATKASLRSFSESLRFELLRKGKRNITVTCVCPGLINTKAMANHFPVEYAKRKKIAILSTEEVAQGVLNAMVEKKFWLFIPRSIQLMPFLQRYSDKLTLQGCHSKLCGIYTVLWFPTSLLVFSTCGIWPL